MKRNITIVILLIAFVAGCTSKAAHASSLAERALASSEPLKIAILTGHGYDAEDWYDSGALSRDETIEEADLNLELGALVQAELTELGHEATLFTENVYRNMRYLNVDYDFSGYDYVLEIHFNSYDTTDRGTEIYLVNADQDTTVETAILDSLETYYRNRGIKYDEYHVIKQLYQQSIPASLLEVAFIDNDADLKIYQANKADIAVRIAEAISTSFGY